MGCNCGKNKKKFVHTDNDGNQTVVSSQSEALRLVRKKGGSYKMQ